MSKPHKMEKKIRNKIIKSPKKRKQIQKEKGEKNPKEPTVELLLVQPTR